MTQRSLEIKEKELGRNHPEYANTMFHLGEVLRLQGKFAEAEKLIRESINILQEGGVGHSQVVMRRMGRLVEILSQAGQLKEAEKLQRKILHNLELSQGVESSNTTTAAENLAGTLQAVGKLTEAEELLQRSFEVRQKILPPTHIQLAVTMSKLASVSVQRGDELFAKRTDNAPADAKVEYERAEELLRRAIRIAERSWKPISGTQGSVAMRAGPLISLLRSLDALGMLEIKKLDLATTDKEVEIAKKEAETLFRHCLAVLDKPGVSHDLASIPEFQRQHVACLRHLAMLLSSAPNVESKSSRIVEADQLLNKAEQIEADLKKHKLHS
ncbi:unnamed protein product [Calypogeia fissa]